MMRQNDLIRVVLEAGVWYIFAYYALYSIKNDVNLYQSAFVLVALVYLAFCICPLVRHTDAWKRLWNQ